MVDTAAGLTSSQAGKAKLELATAIESNAIFNAIAEDTIALLEQSDTPTLAVGSLTKLTDAFVDQLSQVTKVNLFSDGSKINPAMLDKNNISEASRSAALAGRYDTNVASLAAMIAFANNPDGKISDADFRMAQNMISGVTSKAVSIQKIKQVQRNINFRLEAAKEKARFLGVDTSSAPGSAPRQEYSPESDEVYFDDLS